MIDTVMVLTVLSCGAYVGLRIAQARWGLDSAVDAAIQVVASLAPAPTTSTSAVLRKLWRRLPGVSVVAASGASAAAGRVCISLSPATYAALTTRYPVENLKAHVASAYEEHARRASWVLPVRPVVVDVVADVRLRNGWVRIQGLPGAYDPAALVANGRRDISRPAKTLLLEGDGAAAADGTVLETVTLGRDRWTLVDDSGRSFILAASTIVGRDPSADVRLDHELVSRRHLRLETGAADGLPVVTELGSTNGTWIDGSRLDSGGTHLLREGGTLRLGRSGPALVLHHELTPAARQGAL